MAAATGYLLVYAVGSLAVFAVAAAVHSGAEGAGERRLTAYAGLARRAPLLALVLGLGLLTLAGLPPAVVGVLAKVVALGPVVDAGRGPVVGAMIVNIVLGIAVYLRWLLIVIRPADPEAGLTRLRLDPGLRVAIALAGLAVVLLSVAPGLVFGLVR